MTDTVRSPAAMTTCSTVLPSANLPKLDAMASPLSFSTYSIGDGWNASDRNHCIQWKIARRFPALDGLIVGADRRVFAEHTVYRLEHLAEAGFRHRTFHD